tara:strand:- start:2767 stop:4761 length:1995 start_codon:yes stop_codon:yes gene_type:complete
MKKLLVTPLLLFITPSLSFVNTNKFVSRHSHNLYMNPSETIELASKLSKNKIGSDWTYNDFLNNLNNNNIEGASLLKDANVIFAIDKKHGIDVLADNIHKIKTIPFTSDLIVNTLTGKGINFDIVSLPQNPLTQVPFVVQFVLGYLFLSFVLSYVRMRMSGAQGMDNNMMNPLQSLMQNKDLTNTELVDVTFADVAGCEESKNELVEVVDFLKNPDKFANAGAKIPRGILLEGEPGTGKTLLARAVAGEAGVNFISASGSEFIEMFVGVGASRVRNLFKNAKENSPCVIFIDEIDAVGRQRGTGFNSGNDEREQTLNQILTNMDGFEKTTGIIVLAATNRADILDSALLRPGRFDRKVNVPLPDINGRKEISKVHFRNKNVTRDVSFEDIASLTGGFSGADIANLANEAAILSVRYNQTQISPKCVIDAYEKITIGLPSATENRDKEILELVAYHEVGHTITAMLFDDFFNVKRVTINANKGGAGGYTLFTPKERYMNFPTKKFLLANIIVSLGGRAAEVVLYDDDNNTEPSSNNYANNMLFNGFDNLEITTGASADLKQANSIARQYVSQFGLGKSIGLHDSSSGGKPFLGRDMAMGGDKMSEESKKVIDNEVNKLVEFGYKTACNIILKNKNSLINIANELLEKRTLTERELNKYSVFMWES